MRLKASASAGEITCKFGIRQAIAMNAGSIAHGVRVSGECRYSILCNPVNSSWIRRASGKSRFKFCEITSAAFSRFI